jgi:hypothetical protein
MVAETLTTTRAASTFPIQGDGWAGNLKVAYGTYTIAANVEAGDIFEMCKVPAGSTVVGGYAYADDLDTNATETMDMDIGWAANGSDAVDLDGFGNLGVWTGDASVTKPEVGNFFPFGGILRSAGPKTFARDTTIQVYANAAAATGGTGQLTVVVHYITNT